MTKLCISLRPGTLLGYQGKVWRVISNDTLLQRFTCSQVDSKITKSFRYRPGQEIQVRWIPDTRR